MSIKLIDPPIIAKIDGVVVEECYIEVPYIHLSYTEVDNFIKALLIAKKCCLEVNDKIPTDRISYEEYNKLKDKLHIMIDESNIEISEIDNCM